MMRIFSIVALLASGCLKTEYPDERECQPGEYPYEVLKDDARNKETFEHFSTREDIGRYFAPTEPSRIKWSFKENLIFGDDEFPLEYSETESRWIIKDQTGLRIGTFSILSNACWGYYELLLEMADGERATGILRY